MTRYEYFQGLDIDSLAGELCNLQNCATCVADTMCSERMNGMKAWLRKTMDNDEISENAEWSR